MSADVRRLSSSFRDPHGFVFQRDDVVLRQVNEAHRDDYDALMSSGLYEALVERSALVRHAEEDVGLAAAPSAYKVLRPDRVTFVSYPYEWCFGQLRDAAFRTLEIQEVALAHGMSLRDASAYNVQFVRGQPLFIDTLSFETLVEGRPWVAYRQFCEHFLAPLALESLRDPRMGGALRAFLDGLPLDLAADLLPGRARLSMGLQLHLRMHARSQRRYGHGKADGDARAVSPRALQGLVSNLRSTISSLDAPSDPTTWGAYYDEADHYSSQAAEAKERTVGRWIDSLAPATVWDLGANNGRYAFIAADAGAEVVAFDADAGAIEACYGQVRARQARVLPLVMDLTNPSPSLGWAHRERSSLLERGPTHLVIALALVHHLGIGSNVPFDMFVDLLADAGRHAIVEWVPKTDPKVQQMLRTRDDVFDAYTENVFSAEVQRRFSIVAREHVPETERELLLLERR